MEPPVEPPKLNYAIPMPKPVQPTHPVVGIAGFLIYGALFLLFSLPLITVGSMVLERRVVEPEEIFAVAIVTLLWLFTGWRGFAALRGVVEYRKK